MSFLSRKKAKSAVRDMTEGSIVGHIVSFALPLMLGNVFQMLYNTMDSIIVGNFVSKQALAAVGATTMIVNVLVFFFNGFSIGAGVVISRLFGARNIQRLHTAVETTMGLTFLISVLFTAVGVLGVKPMLAFMSTPEDVFPEASVYLRIYFAGISGLLIYNMCSGILRAVGDSQRPLYFLIFTSILNIVLDLLFILVFHWGIAGAAYATIIAQFISAFLTLALLSRTDDIYKLTWKDMNINWEIAGQIFAVGMPAGIQSVITAFSNVFVQSYINFFGSDAMAGWSTYNKLDQFVLLPVQSAAMASTTFVSQNIGAAQKKRSDTGTFVALGLTLGITFVIVLSLYIFAAPAARLFSPEEAVIEYGVLFLHTNILFFLFNGVNHVMAGALRGRGDSTGPMIIMLSTFVGVRQIYLYIVSHFVANTPRLIAFGYPVGWMSCCVIEVSYYLLRWYLPEKRRNSGISELQDN